MQEILEEKKTKGLNLQKQIKSLQREQKRNEHTIVTKFKDTPDVPQDKLKIALNNIPKEEANIANIEKAIQQEKSLIEQKEKLNEDMEAKCVEKEKEINSIKTSQPLSKESCNAYKKQIEDKCNEIEKEKKKSEELKQIIEDLDRKHEEEVKKLKDKIKIQETQLDIASTDFNISDHKLKEIKNIILCQKFKDIQKKKALKKVKASQEGQTKDMLDAIQNAGSIPDSKNPSILNSLNHTQNKEKTKNINAHPVSVMNTHLTEQIKDKDAAVFDLTKVDKGI
jgi:exonuclease SbcC